MSDKMTIDPNTVTISRRGSSYWVTMGADDERIGSLAEGVILFGISATQPHLSPASCKSLPVAVSNGRESVERVITPKPSADAADALELALAALNGWDGQKNPQRHIDRAAEILGGADDPLAAWLTGAFAFAGQTDPDIEAQRRERDEFDRRRSG